MKINQFSSLQQQRPSPEQQDAKLKEASEMQEKYFLGVMLKAMRTTVPEGGMVEANQGEKIFRDMLDDQYVEKWGDRGGIGLGDMIYKNLREKFLPQHPQHGFALRPQGPLSLAPKQKMLPIDNQGKPMIPISMKEAANKQQLSIRYDLQQAALGDSEVRAPWAGSVLGAQQINPGEYVLDMEHDNGLKSRMVFKGQVEKSLPNQIEAGQRIGILSPDARNFTWDVK